MRMSFLRIIALLPLMAAIVFTSCSKDDSEPKPETSFEVIGGNRPAPATVSFNNTTENADSYLWDFGDGTTSEEVNPTHTYEEPGRYQVTLTATNSEGSTDFSPLNRVVVYGELLSWRPRRISITEEKWSEDQGKTVYAVLRYPNGNLALNDAEDYNVGDINVSSGLYAVATFPDYVELSMSNGSIKMEIRWMGPGNTISPDSDDLLFEHTVSIGDLIPDNDTDPYVTELVLENEGVIIDIVFNEKE